VQYLGLTQALRLSQPKFMEQFRRMLVSKLRVVFENASGEFEMWNKSTSAQIDSQLRERRRNFRRRRESLERVQNAASDLELRIAELEGQDERLQGFLARARSMLEALREQACAGPQTVTDFMTLPMSLDEQAALQPRRAQG
jgi:chromosome segregation ATPase